MMDHFKVPEEVAIRIAPERLRTTTVSLLEACGVPASDAERAAAVLLYADTRGIDSHGVSNKLRDYLDKYRNGTLNPTAQPRIVHETPSTAVVDGDRGLGLIVAQRAMEMAIEKAGIVGTGVVSIRNVGHVGAAGFYAKMAADRDMIGWAMAVSAAPKGTVPTFGADPLLGTNPIAFAAPALEEAPFVFDAAMTTIAGNKISLARRIGRPMGPGWIAHPDGTPDMEGGLLDDIAPDGKPKQLPLGSTYELGSHKGYGLAVMVDILTGQLSFAPGFATLADNRGGAFVAAYDVAAFGDPLEFKQNMDGMLRGLRESTPMPGHDRVYYAGLLDVEVEADRLLRGIPLHPEVIDWFRTACADLGVDYDLP
jgi:L-2-hydroxycarboxylate dehydrogenase (NAD+)